MKGKRTESEKVVDAITRKIENPDLTIREIADEVGISKSAAGRAIKDELGNLGTDKKKFDLIEINLQIIEMGKKLILEKMPKMDVSRMSDLNQASQIMETAFKQNQLLTGATTENNEITIRFAE